MFLTSSGLCKLGDFGVSRVLRHTVDLASTQIGTPYYMSPEIMNNQKYNSKTDIWSLGCILYELMCLKLPFGGNSMKQLCHNIINSTPSPPPIKYSKELRELLDATLMKLPKVRIGINSILSKNIMRERISGFLGETKLKTEFNHTVLHNVDILRANYKPIVPLSSINSEVSKAPTVPILNAIDIARQQIMQKKKEEEEEKIKQKQKFEEEQKVIKQNQQLILMRQQQQLQLQQQQQAEQIVRKRKEQELLKRKTELEERERRDMELKKKKLELIAKEKEKEKEKSRLKALEAANNPCKIQPSDEAMFMRRNRNRGGPSSSAVDNVIRKARNVIELVNEAKAKMDDVRRGREKELVKHLDMHRTDSSNSDDPPPSDDDKNNQPPPPSPSPSPSPWLQNLEEKMSNLHRQVSQMKIQQQVSKEPSAVPAPPPPPLLLKRGSSESLLNNKVVKNKVVRKAPLPAIIRESPPVSQKRPPLPSIKVAKSKPIGNK